MKKKSPKIHIPLTVPKSKEVIYKKNFDLVTQKSGNLFLFAGDQRVEHLNGDFYGEGISVEDLDPEHLFKIAAKADIGAFASQFGYIAKYGRDYKSVPYIVKLNSKTNLVNVAQEDPHSFSWISVEQVVKLQKQSGLKIPGVGYTIYIGSEHESQMLFEAAQIVLEAHKHGMIVVLWMYPRGKAVLDEKDAHLIAGAVNVASGLGADFAKVNFPHAIRADPFESFNEVTTAAGRTNVVCAGGSHIDEESFLENLHRQINECGARGSATGRNVHQRNEGEAIAFCNAINAIVVEGKTVKQAMTFLK